MDWVKARKNYPLTSPYLLLRLNQAKSNAQQ